MSTPALDAFAEGFAELAGAHDPDGSWSFGGVAFAGVASTLRPDDPRMAGSGDRMIEVQALTSSLPDPAPQRGNELTRGTRHHRIARADTDDATGYTTFLVSA
jgi:hypothetical protein